MKNKLIILRGLPASGKSTWRKQFMEAELNSPNGEYWEYVNKDELREFAPRDNEKQIHETCICTIKYHMEVTGHNIIIDNTNLRQSTVNQYTQLAYEHGYDWEIKTFDVSWQECLSRNRQRERRVPDSIIIKMAMDAGLYKEEKYRAYIFDLDGTLCNIEHRLHFVKGLPEGVKADWNNFFANLHNDTPNPAVHELYRLINIMRSESGDDSRVIFVSGRPERYRKATEEWLDKYGYRPDLLLMRPDGDRRDDFYVKEKILNKYLKPYFDIVFSVDDRTQVVEKTWRANGIPCFQCAKGDF